MQRIVQNINNFNYSKKGIVVGLLLGTIMTAMGIRFIRVTISQKDVLPVVLAFAQLLIGLACIATEIYRAKKLLKMR